MKDLNTTEKKLIAFDLDGTLAESKTPLDSEMSELLVQLLEKRLVCIISGGQYERFDIQILQRLICSDQQLANLHIMPTCGTRYYRFNASSRLWEMQYTEDFTEDEKKKIRAVLDEAVTRLGYREVKPWGETIEDRGSQVTLSALGQQAPVEAKYAWDTDGSKKRTLQTHIAKLLPEFEVRSGGLTSIDVTKKGIDKAYGMRKLLTMLNLQKEDILFIGDALEPGGNDYPVKAFGIDTIAVGNWRETAAAIRKLLEQYKN